jgi:nucleotide-binding universal stress UspA family protein
MYRVEQVLVPVDFSSFSRSALAFARNLGNESPLVQLVHVLEGWAPHVRNVLFPYAALGEDEVEFEHELIEHAYEHLCKYFRIDRKGEKGLLAEPMVRMGPSKTLLSELSRTVACDMVVVGAFGEGGVAPEALGSTTERLLRSVSQPIALVRDYDRSPRLNHIVAAVDLTPASLNVFAKAVGLALQTGATLETLFVLPSPFTQDAHKLLSNQIKFNPGQALSRSNEKLDALFERLRNSLDVPFPLRDAAKKLMDKRHVLVGDPASEIVRHAYESGADLVVVGAHTPGGRSRALGRVAWTVARTCPTHVLVVPPDANASPMGDD